MKIEINQQTCIKCGKCAKVCPSRIMIQAKAGEPISLRHTDTCIGCGHCVDVCPTASVVHELFPTEKVHTVDRKKLPSPEQLMLLVCARRSNRALLDVPVEQALLDKIIEAAHRAPTASNQQQVSFTLITDPVVIDQCIRFTFKMFMSMIKWLNIPPVKWIFKKMNPAMFSYAMRFPGMARRYEEKGIDPILRGAKTLLLIHAPRENHYGAADCNLAYQNGSLMAETLGVSQIYTGFFLNALRRDKKNKFLRSIGITETVHAGMALGMPQFIYPNYADKKDTVLRVI